MARRNIRPIALPVLLAAALCGAEVSSAYIGNNTGGIDAIATTTQGGAMVRATGSIGCSNGERISIRVTIRQPATDARARARWASRCTGEIQAWDARGRPGGETAFEAGPGRVCADARTRAAGRVTDRKRWCERVAVSEPFERIGPGWSPTGGQRLQEQT